jgi:hypothetical protein
MVNTIRIAMTFRYGSDVGAKLAPPRGLPCPWDCTAALLKSSAALWSEVALTQRAPASLRPCTAMHWRLSPEEAVALTQQAFYRTATISNLLARLLLATRRLFKPYPDPTHG